MNEVTLILQQIDIRKWELFQQYYEPFTILVNSGAFDVRNGSITLNFDANGVLQKVQRSDILFSKSHVIPR